MRQKLKNDHHSRFRESEEERGNSLTPLLIDIRAPNQNLHQITFVLKQRRRQFISLSLSFFSILINYF